MMLCYGLCSSSQCRKDTSLTIRPIPLARITLTPLVNLTPNVAINIERETLWGQTGKGKDDIVKTHESLG